MAENGQPVMVVKLLAMDGNDSTMIKFNLEGVQHRLVPGMPVRVEGLAYDMAKDGGVRCWSATAVVPINGAAAALVASAAGESMAGTRGRNPLGAARHSVASAAGESEGEG
ncbi:hypothetical protein AB0L65_34100 [Nonomuraea sp. NPDC052116]|uniref:hypothetical protein n=1 Tax=Nonomuraea sp. NPDC052116 TaxID=3155665 RepID=UPI00341D2A45